MDAFPDSASQEVRGRLKAALMANFLALPASEIVEKLLDEAGAGTSSNEQRAESVGIDVATRGDVRVLTIGDVVYEASAYPEKPELVPSPVFDIPAHTQVLRGMLADVVAGEKNLLLIGNQGVGKNKLADRLLELMGAEREYMQLHRDSTVGSITLSPGLEDGVIVWSDSPLVRAAKFGRVLCLDECDKAPLEVVSVLKSLVEDGEMRLADGRRLLSRGAVRAESASADGDDVLRIHPDFRLWVLANRPGGPFMGNDFFRAIGDVFSSHIITNRIKSLSWHCFVLTVHLSTRLPCASLPTASRSFAPWSTAGI